MTRIRLPDLTATSPDGQLVLEARATLPPTRYLEVPRGFRYRLRDAGGAVRWERMQPAGELSPHRVFVTDGGWVLIRTHSAFFSNLVVLAPDGATRGRITVTDRAPAPDNLRPPSMGHSSAGPFWDQDARLLAMEHDGAPWLWVAFPGGQRACIHLPSATLRPGPPAVQLLLAETASALATLRSPGPLLQSALLHLIRHPTPEAIADLQRLESLEGPRWGMSSRHLGVSVEVHTARALAGLALRRHGVEPAGHPSVVFDGFPPVPLADRYARLRSLPETLTAAEVATQLGGPDAFSRRRWCYLHGVGDDIGQVVLRWPRDQPRCTISRPALDLAALLDWMA